MPISVKGELIPSNAASNAFAHRWLCHNFIQDEYKRDEYLTKKSLKKWEWKEEEGFPVHLYRAAEGIPAEAKQVIDYLEEALHSPIGVALNLRGYLNVMLEGRSGISLYNMHILDGEIMYREGAFDWYNFVTIPPRSLDANLIAGGIEVEVSSVSSLRK